MSGNTVTAVYADGGVVHVNPSPFAGTWAYCWVDDAGERVREHSGLIRLDPDLGLPTVSNNQAELYALIMALKPLPDGWSGHVFSDSRISLGRLFWGFRWSNIPEPWEAWGKGWIARLGPVTPVLLDGHPNRAQLAAGIGKRGNPCSPHNVRCDELCAARAEDYKAEHPEKFGRGTLVVAL